MIYQDPIFIKICDGAISRYTSNLTLHIATESLLHISTTYSHTTAKAFDPLQVLSAVSTYLVIRMTFIV